MNVMYNVFVSDLSLVYLFLLKEFWQVFVYNKGVFGGLLFMLLIVFCVLFVFWVVFYDLSEQFWDFLLILLFWLEGGQVCFLFGIDELGCDLFLWLIYGVCLLLLIGLFLVVILLIFGIFFGLFVGFLLNCVGLLIMCLMDIMLVLLLLLLVVVIVVIFGLGLINIVIVIVIVLLLVYVCLICVVVMIELNCDYVIVLCLVGVGIL